ncbi:hypothetical protein F947_02637, partial [Acinetobacter towneri DSM 14962 = CIP 107472]
MTQFFEHYPHVAKTFSDYVMKLGNSLAIP